MHQVHFFVAIPLSQTHTIGNDATTKALKLVNSANDPITLELIQFFPHDGISDARRWFHDAVLIEIITATAEEVVQDRCIHAEWVTVRSEGLHICKQFNSYRWVCQQT